MSKKTKGKERRRGAVVDTYLPRFCRTLSSFHLFIDPASKKESLSRKDGARRAEMGFLDSALKNGQVANKDEVAGMVQPVLVGDERVIYALKVGVRDHVAFTDMRLVIIDKQGVSGKRVSFTSYPYKHFLSWSVRFDTPTPAPIQPFNPPPLPPTFTL